MDGQVGKKRKRPGKPYTSAATDSEEDGPSHDDMPLSSTSHEHLDDANLGKTRDTPLVIVDTGFSTTQEISAVSEIVRTSHIGSALKQNSDGTVVAPRIVKRKPKSKTVSHPIRII